jgi:hypothetical protein
MEKYRLIFRDYYRFHFKKIKHKSIHDISIWETPCFSIKEREYKLTKLDEWLRNNILSKNIIRRETIEDEKLSAALITEGILKRFDYDIFFKLFSLFNKKKFISSELSANFSNVNTKISLAAYCNLSLLFITEFKKTNNIQFLNTSLKINDFLLFCQINSNFQKYNGSIPDLFPLTINNFQIDFKTNNLFKNILSQEINILKLYEQEL